MVKKIRVEVSGRGLEQFFSPLEARIMDILWMKGKSTSSELSKILNTGLSSIAGTLDRLVKSGYVRREMMEEGGRFKFVYYPSQTKEEFAEKITEKILSSLIETFGEAVVDNFYKNLRGKK